MPLVHCETVCESAVFFMARMLNLVLIYRFYLGKVKYWNYNEISLNLLPPPNSKISHDQLKIDFWSAYKGRGWYQYSLRLPSLYILCACTTDNLSAPYKITIQIQTLVQQIYKIRKSFSHKFFIQNM